MTGIIPNMMKTNPRAASPTSLGGVASSPTLGPKMPTKNVKPKFDTWWIV
eukprot:CAMPEP_0172794888 /NCGR_PEP_ID=MMETSP1074-20121228/210207_1 /TAXON_ID=2916 /ORGANISM="Ceratium fusus, Strain PA161109" /LENGTH=49 /DNA_ID=CAMNT_0013631969 /DNA_START=617 /DNA_END=766 /DNA_ORIENTATION=+